MRRLAGELGIDTQVSKEEPEEEKKDEPDSGAADGGAAANKKKKKKKKPKRGSQTGQSDDWVKVDAPEGESGDAAAEGEKVCVATLLKSKQKTTKKDTSKAIAAKEAKARAAKKAEAEKKKQKKKKKVSMQFQLLFSCRMSKSKDLNRRNAYSHGIFLVARTNNEMFNDLIIQDKYPRGGN